MTPVRLLGPLVAALVFATAGIWSAAPAMAATLTVNTLDDELNSDGDCSTREAIEAANTNVPVDACPAGDPAPTVDVITFGVAGTVSLTSGQLTVTDDLTIDGPGAANLTLSGVGYPPHRVLEVGAGTTFALSDVTVADGTANSFAGYEGGGVLNAGTLTVTGSTFSGNFAANTGGAIANSGGTATVTDSTFTGNSVYDGGGAIENSGGGSLTVTGSTFSGNSAPYRGGAIESNRATQATVENSTFSANSSGNGGGIWNYAGPLTVTASTFSENTVTYVYGSFGGGIGNYEGTLTITNSTFSDNSSTDGLGGGVSNDGYYASTLTVTNSTFSGNSAPSGGGVYNAGWSPFPSSATLRNTIVANSPSGGNCSGTIGDGAGNLQYPGTDCGGTITSADPMLDPAGLQDNGGPTETIALQTGSPAVDAAVAANCPATDQRGIGRPEGAGCDGGSVEVVQGVAGVVVDDPATLLANGRVKVTGSLYCGPDGDTFRIYVRVDQILTTGAVSKLGAFSGLCSGGVDGWLVSVRKKPSSPPFAPGDARVCFQARSFSGSTETDRLQDCTAVTIASA